MSHNFYYFSVRQNSDYLWNINKSTVGSQITGCWVNINAFSLHKITKVSRSWDSDKGLQIAKSKVYHWEATKEFSILPTKTVNYKCPQTSERNKAKQTKTTVPWENMLRKCLPKFFFIPIKGNPGENESA